MAMIMNITIIMYHNEIQNQRMLGPLEVTLLYLPAQAWSPATGCPRPRADSF